MKNFSNFFKFGFLFFFSFLYISFDAPFVLCWCSGLEYRTEATRLLRSPFYHLGWKSVYVCKFFCFIFFTRLWLRLIDVIFNYSLSLFLAWHKLFSSLYLFWSKNFPRQDCGLLIWLHQKVGINIFWGARSQKMW